MAARNNDNVQPQLKSAFSMLLKNRSELFVASIGIPGLIVILAIALILTGPPKLPQLGKAVGENTRHEHHKETLII